jgi:hypothetical protein
VGETGSVAIVVAIAGLIAVAERSTLCWVHRVEGIDGRLDPQVIVND